MYEKMGRHACAYRYQALILVYVFMYVDAHASIYSILCTTWHTLTIVNIANKYYYCTRMSMNKRKYV